ncbi:hypothetical protein [Microcoleus sp.]|uniref:hypothetical protein n=1 Tax=Microcoleus sp. TaxID=44472 RepID=UPI0035263B1C
MSSFKRFPTSVRYLIARLRHWMQPMVWAPLAVLCAGSLFIWEVSVNPERLSIDGEDAATSNNPTPIAGLSAEDSAIAAEIDSVPLLVNKFNRSNPELGFFNSPIVKTQGLFDEISARRAEKFPPSLVSKQPAINTSLSLPNIANSVASATPNNQANSSLPTANATSALTPSLDGGQTAATSNLGLGDSLETATLSQANGSASSGKKNPNSLPLSPLQAAMKKYIAADTLVVANSTEKTAKESKLPDRLNGTLSPTNPDNLLPTTTTAQAKPNPVNFPTALTPVPASTNIINDSQPVSNPSTTLPESWGRLNSTVPVMPEITIQPVNVAAPKNPYQTNLSGSDFIPKTQPSVIPVATPSPIQLLPNVEKSAVPSAIVETKILNPQLSPNSANSQFKSAQPSQSNSPTQSNFGVVPQNTNQGLPPIPPQPSPPQRQIPGRYLGGGEINTFSNP